MIAYFIKSTLCLALLLTFYHLILEQEKMHKFNRFYLLGSVIFSFLAPIYVIYEYVAKVSPENIISKEISEPLTSLTTTEIIVEESVNYATFIIGIYIFISLILLIRFCRNLFLIIQKIKKNRNIQYKNAKLVLIEEPISPHSFLNYIFINKDEYFSEKIEEVLFTHELAHVTQKHTIDILIIELLQIVFWLNPSFIILKKAIKLNHEFLADNKAITTYKNIAEYQYLLLNRATWNNKYYLASNLNYLLTKKRLIMMTKQSSRTNIILKKLAIIPLVVGSIFLFAEHVMAQKEIKTIETKKKFDNKNKPIEHKKNTTIIRGGSWKDVEHFLEVNNQNSKGTMYYLALSQHKDQAKMEIYKGKYLKAGLDVKYIKNTKNKLYYIYIDKYSNLEDAKKQRNKINRGEITFQNKSNLPVFIEKINQ